MNIVVLVDTGPLWKIVDPKGEIDAKGENAVRKWIQFVKKWKISLRIPEIADYELRRELVLQNFAKNINNLNKFRQTGRFIPITSEVMLEAADLWAWVRKDKGQPTTDNKRLDGDVILAAQAIAQKEFFKQVIVVTGNPKHISLFEDFGFYTWDWKQAIVDCECAMINCYNSISISLN